ncbi:helix-turn-helix domain-containing protein [Nonomuraea sp. NEAU-A123]|uniref:helix-turn-helix domain-containing protein n=1 Tax=Nonomuraea sp. NEAU-A123 TaxID=2839649 RepID=UPI001BE4AA88|nr:helix-turn-helix domain-containing protein [Nonomuraea sp. NEAU-A123]MBT2233940.1 helix-turn-helix domain-containing protein [Nonomuraea sp. NEAU-A123]
MPPDFWADNALQQAFATRHIGRVIRAYRHHPSHGRPLSQERVAGWLRLSQAQLSRVESGAPVQDLTRLITWARLLGMPPARLWFQLPEKTETTAPQSFPGATGHVRSNIVHAVCTAVSADERPPAEAVLTGARRYVDGPVVDVLRQQLDASKTDDGRLGPAAVLPQVLRMLGAVQRAVREAKPDVRRALLAMGADGAEFVGWLYRDLRDLRTATYWYDRAIEWAQEADDSAMQGYVLLRKSQLAYDRRDALRVLTLAEAAQRSTTRLPRKVRAEAAQQEALGLAMLGEPLRMVEQKLDDARQLLARPTSDEADMLGGTFADSTLRLRSTACYTEAGKPGEAAEILGDIIAGDSLSARDAGYFQARWSAALALIGEPDEAAILGLEAARVAQATRSRRTTIVLTEMLQTLSRWGARPHVRELREALREGRTA